MQKKIEDYIKLYASNTDIKLLMPLKDICPQKRHNKYDIINFFTKKNNSKDHLVDWRICKKCKYFLGQAGINKGWPKIRCSLAEK